MCPPLIVSFLRSTSPITFNVTIILDDEDLPSSIQKAIAILKKQTSVDTPAKMCSGNQLIFPLSQQGHTFYPFALHTILSLPWDYSVHCDGFFIISHLCTGMVERNGQCKQCDNLEKNENLKKIVTRYTDGVHENTQLVYHGIGGLIDVVRQKTLANDLFCVCRLNDLKKMVGQIGIVDMHKQMLFALSSQHIPLVDCVLCVGFQHGAGIHSMLELVKKAAAETYHPKSFDEEDDLQALLILHLGGA